MTEKRCRRCGVPHADHPESNKTGGVGGPLAWEDDLCPICLDKRRELAGRAVWRYLAALLAGEIAQPSAAEQTTLPGVTTDA
jgi:hypothetical protein